MNSKGGNSKEARKDIIGKTSDEGQLSEIPQEMRDDAWFQGRAKLLYSIMIAFYCFASLVAWTWIGGEFELGLKKFRARREFRDKEKKLLADLESILDQVKEDKEKAEEKEIIQKELQELRFARYLAKVQAKSVSFFQVEVPTTWQESPIPRKNLLVFTLFLLILSVFFHGMYYLYVSNKQD